mgnify:CR=1 FL=1
MKNEFLRHTLATIDYRFAKATVHFPTDFGTFSLGKGVRTPSEITYHMYQVLAATRIFLQKGKFEKIEAPSLDFAGERDRFRAELVETDKVLSEQVLSIGTAKRLIQGPISDLITHIGQISMMQRLTDNPIPGENFSRASIKTTLS